MHSFLPIAALACGALAMPLSHAGDVLRIEGGWVRAMPPTQRMTAAYMSIRNAGAEPVSVTGASASSAADVSLHTTRRDGDRVRMEAVDTITIAPGETATLAPGGMHVMLMGLERMPAAGEQVELCLQSSAGQYCEMLPVQHQGSSDQ